MIPFIQKYHDSISHIMVGNEPISGQQVPPSMVADAVNCVRATVQNAGVRIPVGVADICPIWLNQLLSSGSTTVELNVSAIGQDVSAVVNAVDWIGLNTHPYYGGVDAHSGHAVEIVQQEVQDIQKKYNKPVIVTETGYPTADSPQSTSAGMAYPSMDGLTRYLGDIEGLSRKQQLPVYIFEPYDGDWKRRWQPYVEADYHFGLATCDRKMKPIALPPLGAL
jgi:exo-beta-1,3-glucanase (GH17 family)